MEKLITFAEEKRRETLYVLYNAIFVCASIVFVLNFLLDTLTDLLSPTAMALTLMRTLCASLSLFIPYLIYNFRQGIPIKKILAPEKKASVSYYVFGTLGVTGLAVSASALGTIPVTLLEQGGYVIHEQLPYIGSVPENAITAVLCSLLIAAFGEFVYRGVLTEKLSRVNSGTAIIIPALICTALSGSIARMPYLLVCAAVLSWLYLKTSSVYVTFCASFVSNLALYVLFYINTQELSMLIPVLSGIVGIGSLAVLFVLNGAKVSVPVPRDEDDAYIKMSGKEALGGVLKAFAFWILIAAALFSVFFGYLSNPNISLP